MSDKVVILGGGIAGLTAAQELAERDFDVNVYEKRSIFGGKARSLKVPDTAEDGRKPLPGEHGFRFFPAFYRHTFDTMRRIPYGDNGQGVFDNLYKTKQTLIARKGAEEVTVPLELPDSIDGWKETLSYIVDFPFDIPADETRFFIDRILTFLTSCEERREAEYDNISWWDFIDADRMSEDYRKLLGVGMTRSLVAMRAEISSTRTIGQIYVQLLLGLAFPWLDVDRVLNGPTNDTWIDPWVQYLRELGVTFYPETEVESIESDGGRVTGVRVRDEEGAREVDGDHYIAALPVEVMREFVDDRLAETAPSLTEIDELETAWMNGIQFYLDRETPVVDGHVLYEGSPWALTSISQKQTWPDVNLSDYGNGEVDDILSVCISNWNQKGEKIDKPARECSPEEIKQEVWAQMTARLNDDAENELDEDDIIDWFLDPGIEFPAPNETTNAEPLLVNTIGSWAHRPPADLEAHNFYVAADYVRTNTDVATMECANEAARRAVNGILDAVNSDEEPCKIWQLREPAVFKPMRAYDRLRFEMGLPHQNRGDGW